MAQPFFVEVVMFSILIICLILFLFMFPIETVMAIVSIIASPLWLAFFLGKFVFQKIYLYNQMVTNGREHAFTIWTKILMMMSWRLEALFEFIVNFYIFMLKGERAMIKTRKAPKPIRYMPKSQRDLPEGEAHAIIVMKPLTRRQQSRIRDGLASVDVGTGQIDKLRASTVALDMTIAQLDGWENVYTEGPDGEVVKTEFDRKRKEEMYEMLPDDLKDELEKVFGSGVYSE